MKNIAKNTFFDKVLEKINKHAENSFYPFVTFGIFGVITYPLYYFIWEFYNSSSYENLYLRLVVCLLCLPLIFYKKWPSSLNKYFYLYWYLTLTYSLPFLFTFLLLKNNLSDISVMNSLTVLVLSILLLDMVAFSIILPVGVFLGWLVFWFTSSESLSIPNYSGLIITYLSVIIFGVLFAHRKEQLQQEKMRIIETVSASLSHELRTPLSAINLSNIATKEYLNDLIDTYHLAKNFGLPVKSLRDSQFEVLQSALQGIELSMKYASVILNMLLVSSEQSRIKKEHFKTILITHCIEEALKRYPFLAGEKELIKWEKGADFYFVGNDVLTIHIIFNLLKNSIYYIRAAGKGNIRIWLENGDKINKLYFRDTGQGIPQNILPHVFDRFFTTTHHGSGIGLAFCKAVMQAYNGEIRCTSIEGEYTEFVLIFPNNLESV